MNKFIGHCWHCGDDVHENDGFKDDEGACWHNDCHEKIEAEDKAAWDDEEEEDF